MRIIIDRFEGEIAVVEIGESMLNVPRALFPEAKEGDTVEITVLGKVLEEGEEAPHELFERLRKKRRNKHKKPMENEESAPPDCSEKADNKAEPAP